MIDFIGGLVQNAIDGALGAVGGLGVNAVNAPAAVGRSASALATSAGSLFSAAASAAPITITLNQTFTGNADPQRVGVAANDGILGALRAMGAA